MAMMPKRIKYRKAQRGRIRGDATRGNFVAFGEYGLQTIEAGWIKANQIEASRVAASHHMHREGKMWIRIFPHKPVSSKPLEVRMGKGKGEPDHYVACVRPGQVLIEVGGVTEEVAKSTLSRVAHKLPLKTRLVTRRHGM
jgi:large subunit ribosomal protein L16